MLQQCVLKSWTPTCSNACAVHIFLIFSDSCNPFNSIQFNCLQFLFWSFWSHLSSAKSWIYSVSCSLLLYIIFLGCHLLISLLRGQDDYIIELNFNSIWISLLGASGSHLMSLSLGASHHSGHRVPLFLASLSSASSAHHLITCYNISDLSLLDRYQDSLNPDSWGSSLVLGMILWLIIRSCSILGI